MTSGPTKPEKDDEAKVSAAPVRSGRPESFFDMAARRIHEFQGDTTNQIVGLIAHQDLAQKFSDSINSQLARQYLEGKALVETRLAQGKAVSDLSGLTNEQLSSVRAYQKVHNDLPASIPLVDRDALIRSVERSIESKVRTARPENTQIPEPHPRSTDLRAAVDAAAGSAPMKSPGRAIAKPYEPEARELKTTKSESAPVAQRTLPAPHPLREDKPVSASEATVPPARAQEQARSAENNAAVDKHVLAPLRPEAPQAVAQSAAVDAGRAIHFSPLLRTGTLPPEWVQPRLETFSLKHGQAYSEAATTGPTAAVPQLRIVAERLLTRPLPYCPPQLTPQRLAERASAVLSNHSNSSARWSEIAVRLARSPVPKAGENSIGKSSPSRAFDSGSAVVQRRMHIVRLAVANQGFPIGRNFDQSLRLLPLRPLAPRQNVDTARGMVAAPVRSDRARAAFSPAGALPAAHSDQKAKTESSTKERSTEPMARSVETRESPAIASPGSEHVDVSAHAGVPEGPLIATDSVDQVTQAQRVEPHFESELDSGSELDSETELDPEPDLNAREQHQVKVTKTFVVRGSMPDKRYITGGELAFVAIMALASASRVRPEENAGEHGLGMVRREYVMVEEEEGVAWTEPGYELPQTLVKPDFEATAGRGKTEPEEIVAGTRRKAESERKILMRPQIIVQVNDDLSEMAAVLFNDTRYGHLIADLNRHSTKQKFEGGARVVMLATRQRISLPVYQDILRFSSGRLHEAGETKLITIVESSAIDRELLEHGLAPMLGINSPNKDPLEPA